MATVPHLAFPFMLSSFSNFLKTLQSITQSFYTTIQSSPSSNPKVSDSSSFNLKILRSFSPYPIPGRYLVDIQPQSLFTNPSTFLIGKSNKTSFSSFSEFSLYCYFVSAHKTLCSPKTLPTALLAHSSGNASFLFLNIGFQLTDLSRPRRSCTSSGAPCTSSPSATNLPILNDLDSALFCRPRH